MTVRVGSLRPVEAAHARLGLTFREIAAAVGADESTLHRWRSGGTGPSPVFLARLHTLGELLDELGRVFPSDEEARSWLDAPLGDGGATGGGAATSGDVAAATGHGAAATPRDLLRSGRLERLAALLLARDDCAPS